MEPDLDRLRATVEHLASFDRPSASEGERQAAEWIRGELEALGAPARVEEEPAVGSMSLPLGLLSAAGVLAALGGRRTAPLGLLAAAGIVDDVSGGPHLFRRLLPHRPTYNVTATAGDPDAEETLVFVAHHDAANGGLIFRPELTRLVADTFPAWYAAPAARRRRCCGWWRPARRWPASARCSGARLLRRHRRRSSRPAAALAFFDIGTRTVVPGANDNLTAVAVILELARHAAARSRSRGVRVLLVSTGSEESFMEGMRGWVRRHAPRLDPRAHARRRARDAGLPGADPARGRGHDLDDRLRRRACRDPRSPTAADAPASPLRRGLRLGFATDALSALRGGLPRGDARLLRRVQDARQLPLPARHPAQRRLRHGGGGGARRRGRDQVSSERARLIASSRVAISPA